jgi:hypothetical protein
MSLDLLNKSVAATELLSQRPENAELLSKIMNWDFTKVENRYCKMYPDRDAVEARRQFCIFVYLTLATGQELYIPSYMADDFWHIALWFTHDWMAFSEYVAGRFLHHQPLCVQPNASDEEARLQEFRQACIQHFGEVNVFVEAVVCCM